MKHVLIVFSFLFLFFSFGCTNQDVASVASACKSDGTVGYSCVVEKALEKSRPDYCYALGAIADDACMQEYYQQKNDSGVCASIPKEGVRETCKSYYREKLYGNATEETMKKAAVV